MREGEFVEHARYSGRRYGTLRSELKQRLAGGHPVVLEIEVQGARQIREEMPEAVQIFIAPPSEEALRARLVGRGTDDPEQVSARLETAREELRAQDEFAHVVINDRLEDASDALEQFVRAHLDARGDDLGGTLTAGRRRSAQRPAAGAAGRPACSSRTSSSSSISGRSSGSGSSAASIASASGAARAGGGCGPGRRGAPGTGTRRLVVVAERRRARQRLVQHGAEPPDVGGRAREPAARLLGREVAPRAEAGLDEPRAARDREVDQLRRARVGDHVRRLEVEVDEPLAVQVAQRAADLQPEVRGLGRAEPAPGDQRAERRPAQRLQHDERPRAVAHLVGAHEVRVGEPREQPPLAAAAPRARRASPQPVGPQRLDGDAAAARARTTRRRRRARSSARGGRSPRARRRAARRGRAASCRRPPRRLAPTIARPRSRRRGRPRRARRDRARRRSSCAPPRAPAAGRAAPPSPSASSPVVGSSSTSTGVSRTSARAIASRWRWPPDSVRPRWPSRVA